ncbi:MAG: FAD:protein FMN transferase [bacterium]|nr:FAD:protein FMN transferase [Candidatus Neomarinimicrobiota bacterium]MDD3966271.1 FAD:protein FMN transferase [Candidatus Neomarinimicrobiota bacterium]MDX9779745.1 FAD:protein FMN transferase [bacterium]
MPKKTSLLFAGFCSLLALVLLAACSAEPLVQFRGQTMGTFYTVKIAGKTNPGEQAELQQTIDSVLSAVNRSLNRYDKNSEIAAFNRYRRQDPYPVSAEFMEVTRMADQIYRRSCGAFDPTVSPLVRLWGFGDDGAVEAPHPDTLTAALKHVGFKKLQICGDALQKNDPYLELDYSAIAKGYGVDLLAEALQRQGYENVLVEIGGEVRVLGTRSGKAWRLGIAAPEPQEGYPAVIDLSNMACATSGDYQQFYMLEGKRYSHLIDPGSGHPIEHELTSVTVIAQNCMLADATATAAIVLGKDKGMAFIESLQGVEAYFIYHDGTELQSIHSSGWNAFLP